MNDQLRIREMAVKCALGNKCSTFGCWNKIEEGTLCVQCDKRRQERDEDVLREGETNGDIDD